MDNRRRRERARQTSPPPKQEQLRSRRLFVATSWHSSLRLQELRLCSPLASPFRNPPTFLYPLSKRLEISIYGLTRFKTQLLDSRPRFLALFVFSSGFAIASTIFLGLHLLTQDASSAAYGISGGLSATSVGHASPLSETASLFESGSVVFAPTSWIFVGGLWIWRGRTKAAWTSLGFDSEVFELFMRMKGGNTRTRVMSSLSMPKDRLQLAQELGLDWKAVDHHIVLLCKYGFVHEQVAYGRVKMYELTDMGKVLLRLLKETQSGNVQPNSAPEVSPEPRLQNTPN